MHVARLRDNGEYKVFSDDFEEILNFVVHGEMRIQIRLVSKEVLCVHKNYSPPIKGLKFFCRSLRDVIRTHDRIVDVSKGNEKLTSLVDEIIVWGGSNKLALKNRLSQYNVEKSIENLYINFQGDYSDLLDIVDTASLYDNWQVNILIRFPVYMERPDTEKKLSDY